MIGYWLIGSADALWLVVISSGSVTLFFLPVCRLERVLSLRSRSRCTYSTRGESR